MIEKLKGIIIEVMEINGKDASVEILESTSLRNDLEFDSFDLAVLTVNLEDEFDVDIFEDGLVDTVGEILSKLSKE